MQSSPTVSIIIPAYNAAAFIGETIDSILNQTYSDFEIIVINDGSTDDTEGGVKFFLDKRVQYFYKKNEGVSIARNTGFGFSKGKYLVFFDADDVMSPDFLERRVKALDKNTEIGFYCGEVEHFPIKNEKPIYGACLDISREILLYQQDISTCPSNYMFRRSVLETHKIQFHPELSSPADRLFLMQVAAVTQGERVEGGHLKYRVREGSMSALTEKWLADNEKFYTLLKQLKLIPPKIATEVSFKKNNIFARVNWRLNRKRQAFICGVKLFMDFIKISINLS
jgi:teichuronic acid biosynthesis glycosyltransferase TuaG